MLRLILVWLLAIIFPAPMLWAAREATVSTPDNMLSVLGGTLAYCWWLLAILLSLRWRPLDRLIGLKEIYALHGTLGIGALILAWLHKSYSYTAWDWVQRTGNWAFWLEFAIIIYSILFLSGWIVDHFRPAARLKHYLEFIARHQVSVWIHRLNIVAVILVTAHVHLIQSLTAHHTFINIFDAYTITVLIAYAYRKILAPGWFSQGVVSECRQLTPTLTRVEVTLKKQVKDLRIADFFFVTFPTLGHEAHPFSVTYSDKHTVAFTIRNVGDGTCKIPTLHKGDPVRLEGPFGRFWSETAEIPAGAPLLLVGLGTGMSALLALAHAETGKRPLRMVWIARQESDFFSREELEQMDMQTLLRIGRMHLEDWQELLQKNELESGHVFIVGPAPAVINTRRALRKLGYADSRIHDEHLTM